MHSEHLEPWFKLTEFNKVATEIGRKIAQQNVEIMGETISRFSERLKHVSTVKKPEEFFNLQKDFIAEDLAISMKHFQKMLDTSLEGIQTFTDLCGSCHKTANKMAEKMTEKTNINK